VQLKSVTDIGKKVIKQKKHTLLRRTGVLPIYQYRKKIWEVPQSADMFKIVKVAKTDNPKDYTEIVTFYDRIGNIIRKCKSGTNVTPQIKDFEYSHRKLVNIFSGHSWAEVTKITTRELINPPNIKKYKKSDLKKLRDGQKWQQTLIEEQFEAIIVLKTVFNRVLTIIKNKFNPNQPSKMHAEIVEYPLIKSRGAKTIQKPASKKVLALEIETKNDIPHIVSVADNTNVKITKKDKFLPFRFYLDKATKYVVLSKHFLKAKGLEKLNIKILTNQKFNDETAAFFDTHTGELLYSNECTNDIVKTVAHEVEHAYQFSLIGRAGGDFTDFVKKCGKLLPRIKNENRFQEIIEYLQAYIKYPQRKNFDDISIYRKAYRENLLEVKADKAGDIALAQYNRGKKSLFKQFKYLPEKNTL
jgi:hypothetical protein